MMFMVVLVGCIGAYYQRGAVASAAVISYMVTALLGGFVSANLYQKLGGEKWAWPPWQSLSEAILWPGTG